MYKRNQVEWSCWRANTLGRGEEVPNAFLTRIKRLLELDRQPLDGDNTVMAFSSSNETVGKGSEAIFSTFDAFCLCLGLDLLDLGFKQSEVVFFLRHTRKDIQDIYSEILKTSKVHGRNRYGINKDSAVFMIIRKIELKELFPLIPKEHKGPVISPPEFCFGSKEFTEKTLDTANRYRKFIVIELAKIAALLNDFLPQAPVRTRGRG
jgi:hypothetical protein